jgi:hypothetical protein
MHSDSAEIKKSVRTYMMIGAALLVFTGITVAANLVHLAVPVAITVALIFTTLDTPGKHEPAFSISHRPAAGH